MSTMDPRVAVVTGAASGIGAATARALAAHGMSVALFARRAQRLEHLAADVNASGGRAIAVPVDVTDNDAVTAATDTIHDRLGDVDVVVNNAGVMLAAPLEEYRFDDWRRMVDTNLLGVLRIIRAFTPDLVKSAADGRSADLVNISSIGAHVSFPQYAVYGATKAAVTHLSTSLRTELGPQGVRVTNIEPGLTDTELVNGLSPQGRDTVLGMQETIGVLRPEDIADLVGYAVTRAKGVNLRHIVALPTGQA